MTPDEAAEPYAEVAEQCPTRLREGPPQEFHRWLYESMRVVAAVKGRPGDMPTVSDWIGMCTLLTAAIVPDVEWDALTDWVRRPDARPHGTMAALRRHQYHRERPCALCRSWEAGFKAGRYQRAKDAKEAA